jgi:predicted O-methyltransferase YrrM
VQTLHRHRAYLSYWLNAIDEHSLHAPFLFRFVTEVLRGRHVPDAKAEQLRARLLHDPSAIEVRDLGSGANSYPAVRRVSAIARRSLSPMRLSSLYQRMITHYGCKTVVELGTCLGINTLYLARPAGTQVYTFEGAPSLAALARRHFAEADQGNIRIIEGNIDVTLREFVTTDVKADWVLIDANHTEAATLRYFELLLKILHENSILVIDDIHHSPGMESAWRQVQEHSRVRVTADLYRCGIAFFSPLLNKQHVVLRM